MLNESAPLMPPRGRPDILSAKPASKTLRKRRPSVDVVEAKEALDLATAQTYSENVFLFVPNLIGYSRVIFAAISLYYMPYHPKASTIAYGISSLLDAFDGYAARKLGQTSKFGAVLDMVTDRCATSCLLCYLASAYPKWSLLFQFLISLDFSSHYMHMVGTLTTGAKSHKLITADVSRILWLYYNDSRTLFIMCAGNELFFVALYLIKWVETPLGLPYFAFLPWFISSFVASMTWAHLMAVVTFPIFFVKNVINMVQLWKGSKILVGADLVERQAKLHEKPAMTPVTEHEEL